MICRYMGRYLFVAATLTHASYPIETGVEFLLWADRFKCHGATQIRDLTVSNSQLRVGIMIKVNWLKSLDYIGKFLLCWFVLETIIYYWSGSFFTELDDVFYLFSVESYGEALHLMFMMAVSGLVIVIMGPFLLEGKWAGILLVILYSALGNTINPFWYVFPDQWQGTSYEPTGFLSTINITWSAIVLMGMAAFFYFRRWKPVVETQTDGHIDHGSLTEEEKEKAVGE